MNDMKMVTNLKPIVKDVRIQKNRICQKDESSLIFILGESKEPMFEDDFVIRDITAFEKALSNVDSIEEKEDRVIIKKKDTTIEWMKADKDIVGLSEKTPEDLDFTDAVKLILTDEVKGKLIEAIDTNFSNIIAFYSDSGSIKCSVGGAEGKHKFVTTLTASDKELKFKMQGALLKEVLNSVSGYSEIFLKSGIPTKVVNTTKEYVTTIFVAPYVE